MGSRLVGLAVLQLLVSLLAVWAMTRTSPEAAHALANLPTFGGSSPLSMSARDAILDHIGQLLLIATPVLAGGALLTTYVAIGSHDARDSDAPPRGTLQRALPRAPAAFATGAIAGVAILAAFIVPGTSLLFLRGDLISLLVLVFATFLAFFILTSFALAVPLSAIERRSPFESLDRSIVMSNGCRRWIAGAVVLPATVLGVLVRVLPPLGRWLAGDAGALAGASLAVIVDILGSTSIATVAYGELA